MSNINAKRNVNAKPKPSVCELAEKELDQVSGGFAVGGNGGVAFNINGNNTNFARNGG